MTLNKLLNLLTVSILSSVQGEGIAYFLSIVLGKFLVHHNLYGAQIHVPGLLRTIGLLLSLQSLNLDPPSTSLPHHSITLKMYVNAFH